MPDLGPVLSAATTYGDGREAEGREGQRAVDALVIADQNAEIVRLGAALTAEEAEVNRLVDELNDLQAEFDAYVLAHPDEEPDPDPDPDPEPVPSIAELVQGTWPLQQVSTVAELDRLEPQILAALALDGVVGFSLRWPWDAADVTGSATSHPLWERGLAIAKKAGKQFAPRFMAGAHTPKRIFDAGAAYYLKGSAKVPLPWSNTTGNHTVFLREYQTYAGKLADWCRANDVHLLHLSWFGQDWAELNHGQELRNAPGYTEAKWLAGSKALIDVAPNVLGDGLACELPLSGYGPLSGGQSAALADHILTKIGEHPDEFFVQANGLGPNGEWGAPSADVERQFDAIWSKAAARGVQMIQPQDYDWAAIYDHAGPGTNNANATYVEVYLPSFALTNKAQLRTEIAAFKEN